MYTVALTGGIASGKTAVSDMFAEIGVSIVDTDLISREVVMPGSEGIAAIVSAFGSSILESNGSLNRRKLREIVFADKDSLQTLEEITHPLIEKRAKQLIDSANGDFCILVVPLLLNSQMRQWADRILVVDVNEELQLQRFLERDCETVEQAQAIITTQASRQQLLDIADDVIINDAGLEKLRKQVQNLHNIYIQAASARLQNKEG